MEKGRLKAFISSRMAELTKERAVIKKLLDEAEVDAWVFEEDAGARPKTIQETYLEEVEEADIYIGIFWKGYGAYTIEEFEYAQKLQKPCFLYEKRVDLENRDLELQEFLDEISQVETGLTIQWFDTIEELRENLKRDLIRWRRDETSNFDSEIVSDVPIEFLPRAENFIGRKNELRTLVKNLKPGEVVTITGPGGMGKTALAAEALWQLTIRGNRFPVMFPDGVITHTFYGNPNVDLFFDHIVNVYGVEAKPSPEKAARNVLRNKQALLVLDGAEEADNLGKIFDIRGRCCVLVTSRNRGDAYDLWQELLPMNLKEASILLNSFGKEYLDDEIASKKICDLVGKLPLAVRLAGKYIREHGELASEFLIWLEKTPLQALEQGKQRRDSVPILLEKSLNQVSENAKKTLGVVGLLALAPFDFELIVIALEKEKRPIQSALGELVKFGLLSREGKQYLTTHALVHTYARRRMKVLEESRERLIEYYDRFVSEKNKKGASGYQEINEKIITCQTIEPAATNRSQPIIWTPRGTTDQANLPPSKADTINNITRVTEYMPITTRSQASATLAGRLRSCTSSGFTFDSLHTRILT